MTRFAAAAALALALVASRGTAQTASELVARGIASYRALEYDAAVPLFLRALRQSSLSDSARAHAAGYLGATQLFRSRLDSAALAWRDALVADPRYRPDALVFPPEVTEAFETVRRVTRVVRVAAPADTTIVPGRESFVVKLYASTAHNVQVDLALPDGTARRLYEGRVGDSLAVRWDGLGGDRAPARAGRGMIQVTSQAQGVAGRVTALPLQVEVLRKDTVAIPTPPDESLLLPEQSRAPRSYGGLFTALLVGAAAIALPSMIASDNEGMPARYVVGGALGVAGVVGFVTRSRAKAIPTNEAANSALREAWQRDVARARAENEQRRRDIRLRISTTSPGSTAPEVP
jgi:hypothetical protein